ncbi:class I fructose-bisphosphate aldolase [Aeromicrobium sp.]|uniref:class I fructose-bisphosphate aldolase n=1 Tax=Aeromicrobium sp. TaxID=1871063 RepID=UPI0019A083A0|nr:class I fructose-bisphosphate aldolase [Aeromicrobium sp.]MBC7633824.1 fructose-bisphosphate aldolase class I [Aeromicrobium sp.]
MHELHAVATHLVGSGRGILAADESVKTMSIRLNAEGIAASPTARRDYRELLPTAPDLAASISGIILCDETFNDSLADGTPFPQACRARGILPGIKVDTGTSRLPGGGGATVTEGLDGLGARLATYAASGAAFAKWRAAIDIATATDLVLEANAHALARYAALCQEHGIVPIVEPEVLCGGGHTIGDCAETTSRALTMLFDQLDRQRVDLAGIVLKPNMVTPGLHAPAASPAEVAAATNAVLRATVPDHVPGIAFLSGGHAPLEACRYLLASNAVAPTPPWHLTFSFGRALVNDALHAWQGQKANIRVAQDALLLNCANAAAARAESSELVRR